MAFLLAQKYPAVARADLNAVAAWIRAHWTADEIEYEFISARKVNSFREGDFDTEARSARLYALRDACLKPDGLSARPFTSQPPYTLTPPMNVRDVLDRWAPGGLKAEERFRDHIFPAWLGQYVCVDGRYRRLYLRPALGAALEHLAVPNVEVVRVLDALTCCDGHCVGCANDAECEAIATYDPADTRP